MTAGLLVAAPLLGVAGLAVVLRIGPRAAAVWTTVVSAGVLAAVVATLPLALRPGPTAALAREATLPLRFEFGGVGSIVTLVAAAVWTIASLQAIHQIPHDRRAGRYHAASLASLSAMIGVALAADLVTLYVTFEWLGLLGYLLVVHDGRPASKRAGRKYLVLVLLGGAALLAGVVLAAAAGVHGSWTAFATEAPGRPGLTAAAATLLAAGFAVKVGALGVHVWLPDAHRNAPAPASALLSGVIVNAGAIGLLRTAALLLRAGDEAPAWAAAQSETLAVVLLGLGTASAVGGAFMALLQNHAKRLLAYSTISQMGFITMGIGAIGLDPNASLAWSGTLAHLAHHALVKATLFLAFGAALQASGVSDVRRMTGLARRMPWTFGTATVAAAALAGAPWTSGFATKTALHHAVGHLAAESLAPHGAAGGTDTWTLRLAGPLFTVAAIGTAAALTKLLAAALSRPRGATGAPEAIRSVPSSARAAAVLGAAGTVMLGARPQALASLLDAGRQAWGLPAGSAAIDLVAWSGDPGSVLTAVATIAAGVAVHIVLARTGVYDRPVPAWASWDRITTAAAQALDRGLRGVARPRDLSDPSPTDAPTTDLPPTDAPPTDAPPTDPSRPIGATALAWSSALVARALQTARGLDGTRRIREPADRRDVARDRWVRRGRARIERWVRDVGMDVAWIVTVGLLLAAVLALGAHPTP